MCQSVSSVQRWIQIQRSSLDPPPPPSRTSCQRTIPMITFLNTVRHSCDRRVVERSKAPVGLRWKRDQSRGVCVCLWQIPRGEAPPKAFSELSTSQRVRPLPQPHPPHPPLWSKIQVDIWCKSFPNIQKWFTHSSQFVDKQLSKRYSGNRPPVTAISFHWTATSSQKKPNQSANNESSLNAEYSNLPLFLFIYSLKIIFFTLKMVM